MLNVPIRLASVLALTLALLAAAPAAAQGDARALDLETLLTLHQAGLGETEILQVMARRGVPTLNPDALARLQADGFPEVPWKRLEEQARSAGLLKLTLADVIQLAETGTPGARIIEALQRSGSTFELTVDQQVDAALRGVPAPVLRYMRENSGVARAVAREATTLSLEDVVGLSVAGIPADEILRRIRQVDARFSADIDDVIALSRKKVDRSVIREICDRSDALGKETDSTGVTTASHTPDAMANPGASSQPSTDAPAFRFMTHREPTGGFSVNAPRSFFIHRERRGPNSLVSFTDRTLPEAGGLPDAEIQVFRFRTQNPERLTAGNLDAIAQNFLNRLKTNYAQKGMTLTYGRGESTFLSGRPAERYQVASSDKEGTTHEGELFVTWHEDQIFVVSHATLAQRQEELGHELAACLRSFTLESEKEAPETSGSIEERLGTLFDAWKSAVANRDFALYRALHPPGYDNTETRRAFVILTDRLARPELQISLQGIVLRESKDEAEIRGKVIGPTGTEELALPFIQTGEVWRLKP